MEVIRFLHKAFPTFFSFHTLAANFFNSATFWHSFFGSVFHYVSYLWSLQVMRNLGLERSVLNALSASRASYFVLCMVAGGRIIHPLTHGNSQNISRDSLGLHHVNIYGTVHCTSLLIISSAFLLAHPLAYPTQNS